MCQEMKKIENLWFSEIADRRKMHGRESPALTVVGVKTIGLTASKMGPYCDGAAEKEMPSWAELTTTMPNFKIASL